MKLFKLLLLMFGTLNAASVYYKDGKGIWHTCNRSCTAYRGVKGVVNCKVDDGQSDCHGHPMVGGGVLSSQCDTSRWNAFCYKY